MMVWRTYRQVRHLTIDLQAVCRTEATGWTDEDGVTCRECLSLLHQAVERGFRDSDEE